MSKRKKSKKSKKSAISKQTIISLVFGIILIILYAAWNRYEASILSFHGQLPKVRVKYSLANKPVFVDIAKVNLHIPIVESEVVGNIWQINQNGASHLATSDYPGYPGNIVIYAHNKDNLFGPIRWLSKGDKIGRAHV